MAAPEGVPLVRLNTILRSDSTLTPRETKSWQNPESVRTPTRRTYECQSSDDFIATSEPTKAERWLLEVFAGSVSWMAHEVGPSSETRR